METRQDPLRPPSSGTDRVAYRELAATKDGTILGMRYRWLDNVGGDIRSPAPGCQLPPPRHLGGPPPRGASTTAAIPPPPSRKRSSWPAIRSFGASRRGPAPRVAASALVSRWP